MMRRVTLPSWFPAVADIAVPALAALVVAAATVVAQFVIAKRARDHQASEAAAERDHRDRLTLRNERRDAYVRVLSTTAAFATAAGLEARTNEIERRLLARSQKPTAAQQAARAEAKAQFQSAILALHTPNIEAQLLASETVSRALADLSGVVGQVRAGAIKGNVLRRELLGDELRRTLGAMRRELGHGKDSDTLPGPVTIPDAEGHDLGDYADSRSASW